MKRKLTIMLYAVTVLSAVIALAGCSAQESAQETALKGVDKESIPAEGHEIYGVSYAVPETQWTYMFNADQLGDGEELIDLDISGGEAEEGVEAYWKEVREAEEYHEDHYVLKDSGKETIDGRDCFWYDKYDDGHAQADLETMPYWRKTLLIPQSEGNKYVKISSDFIQEEDKKKADKLFKELLNGIEFADSKAYIVNEDYICLGGACIPAKGLQPTQLFYGLMDLEETGGLVSAQIGFSSEKHQQDVEKIFEGMDWDEDSPLQDDGTLEIDGVKVKWYTWLDRLPDSMTYLSYNMMIPLDDGKQIVSITYDFNGDVDDLSQYDDQIKELTEQVHITKAN